MVPTLTQSENYDRHGPQFSRATPSSYPPMVPLHQQSPQPPPYYPPLMQQNHSPYLNMMETQTYGPPPGQGGYYHTGNRYPPPPTYDMSRSSWGLGESPHNVAESTPLSNNVYNNSLYHNNVGDPSQQSRDLRTSTEVDVDHRSTASSIKGGGDHS
jgi:hypothetical protein